MIDVLVYIMFFENLRHVFIHFIRTTNINFAKFFGQTLFHLFVESMILVLERSEVLLYCFRVLLDL